MNEPRCAECGRTFRTPVELQEHVERIHGVGKKGGETIAPDPPNDARR